APAKPQATARVPPAMNRSPASVSRRLKPICGMRNMAGTRIT
ncbi:hypothetical protein, partial [Cronobacter sakazakii]